MVERTHEDGVEWHRANRRLYWHDVLCSGCEQWCMPYGHDKTGEIYCYFCAEGQEKDEDALILWDAQERIAYKAVSKNNGTYFSLGMGGAKVIPLPVGEWIEGREHGISAGRSKSAAKQVIGYAEERKKLPIPRNMEVVKVIGKGIRLENKWRYVFDQLWILEEDL